VKFHPNSYLLAFSTEIADGQIQLWDLNAERIVELIPGHGGWTSSIAFNADGSLLASGAGLGCCPRIWNLEESREERTFIGHTPDRSGFRGIYDVAFSADDSLLASNGRDGTIRIWDVTTGKQCAVIDDGFVDDSYTASFPSNFWDEETPQMIDEIRATAGGLSDMVFSPDKTMIAVVTVSGELWLFDATNADALARIQVVDWRVESVDWSTDGRRIAVTGREGSIHVFGVRDD
jgi:WD40 repeat protein